MPISRASSRASSSSPPARLALVPVTATAAIAEGQLRGLGHHGAVDAAGERHGAAAVAAEQGQQLVAFFGQRVHRTKHTR